VFDTKHFSFDSCKENLPKKRIHQNYALIAVRRGRVFDGASARNDRLRHGSSGRSSFSIETRRLSKAHRLSRADGHPPTRSVGRRPRVRLFAMQAVNINMEQSDE